MSRPLTFHTVDSLIETLQKAKEEGIAGHAQIAFYLMEFPDNETHAYSLPVIDEDQLERYGEWVQAWQYECDAFAPGLKVHEPEPVLFMYPTTNHRYCD